jgi:DNA invertase Pin-like site-specific DNA recombinase
MKIACYCRVSTRHQKNDSQESEIRKWLNGNGIDPAQVEWYFDHESGKTLARPEFERLQKDIFNGVVKTVIVWKLDRLSRRLRDGVNLLADWCERGLKIVVITQQIELNGPVGRMIAAVMLGLAEIELEYRRERQMAGIEVARKKGLFKGRQKGTTKGKPRRANELKTQGLTAPEIAKALGTSVRTVFRYLETSSA